jgi:hypothetical protein
MDMVFVFLPSPLLRLRGRLDGVQQRGHGYGSGYYGDVDFRFDVIDTDGGLGYVFVHAAVARGRESFGLQWSFSPARC